MTRPEYFRAGALLGALMLLAAGAGAASLPAPGDLLENIDFASLEESILENLPPELELPDAEDWQIFWNRLETILQSQSLDDMSWLRPAVQQACEYLDTVPATRPWADWLRQRRDYFEMADIAVQAVPEEPAISPAATPPPPPAPSAAVPEAKPPPSPAPAVTPAIRQAFHESVARTPPARAPLSPQAASQRYSLVRNSSRWHQKLADRPAPPNAAALIPRLKKVFQSEGLPPELVWMAEVESSLNPAARSPAGALGLFQLMPATARRFGLHTGFFDERKHPEKSARAAASYLKVLYRTMGSWPLALAAYNAGEGRVGRLIKRKKQSSFESIADDLPLETQMYVPKVMALIALREKTAPEKMPGPLAAAGSFAKALHYFAFAFAAPFAVNNLNTDNFRPGQYLPGTALLNLCLQFEAKPTECTSLFSKRFPLSVGYRSGLPGADCSAIGGPASGGKSADINKYF